MFLKSSNFRCSNLALVILYIYMKPSWLRYLHVQFKFVNTTFKHPKTAEVITIVLFSFQSILQVLLTLLSAHKTKDKIKNARRQREGKPLPQLSQGAHAAPAVTQGSCTHDPIFCEHFWPCPSPPQPHDFLSWQSHNMQCSSHDKLQVSRA